ncbi:MAG: flagellar biosynthetic protein FliR [Myxococcales bacterium]|nr:flagellar biosynthetic protein FliR [Myxococcales bacterium]
MTAATGWALVLALARIGPAVVIALAGARAAAGRTVAAAVAVMIAVAVATLGEGLLAPGAAALATGPLSTQVAILARELALGASLGVTAAVPLVAAELIGSWLATTLGDTDEASPWATATGLLGALVFFALGGHRAVMVAVVASYQVAPPAAGAALDATAVLDAGATLFGVAVALAVPVLGAVVVAALALGAVERASGLAVSVAPTGLWLRLAAVLALAAMVFAVAHGLAGVVRALPTALAR